MSEEEILKRVEEIKARGNSPAREAPDPVNVPMIRHWAEAIGDTNPRWAPGPDTEAPPAMAQVWTMYGLNPERMPGDPLPDTMSIFDEAGYTSVLGTNCDQTYARTLRPGEVPRISTRLAEVVGPKKTGVGEGWFITTQSTWTVGDEEVATMRFRVLKFKPGTGRPSVDKSKSARPMINRDTAFFWEGTAAGELRIQKCNACGELRHPPGPVCPSVPRDGSRVCRGVRPRQGALVPGAPRAGHTGQAAAADPGAGRPRRGRPDDRRGQRRGRDRRCRRGVVRPDRRRRHAGEVASGRHGGARTRTRAAVGHTGLGAARSRRPSWCRRRWRPATSRTCTTTGTGRSGTAARTSSSTS